ncbi:MAG: ABC transporter ATP-binding protein, partial [Oscillospiraceae bacterium]|nr:ABC transporter ATP-binding protein [Oscillospiraceae bacterium]
LDEPTNHLDLASREWIEGVVDGYDETLIFISHDRYFIDRFATRIWELSDGEFTDFKGTYAQYMENKKSPRSPQLKKASDEGRGGISKGDKAAKKKLKPSDSQKELRRLEREITKIESEIDDLALQKEQHSSDYEKLMELESKEQELSIELERLLAEWEAVAE